MLGVVTELMASPAKRLPANVDGDFYVDSSCIDCDACRIVAPQVFAERGEQSAVYRQPQSDDELLTAQKALLACPTSSIGDLARRDMRAALAAYPERIDSEVHFCGFTSEDSFGALSYFITRERGNVLIDSPRFSGPIVRNIAAAGGVDLMLLTHRDDVADHSKFRERFGCTRVLHRDDVTPTTAGVEQQPEGLDPVQFDDELLMIPVPGHTRGHAVFLYRNRYLFTGDHLAWSPRRERLVAFRNACWYSWSEQTQSMKRLLDFDFEWVLPGHGRSVQLPRERMKGELERCIRWMEKS